jgi:hypothetical protein
MTEEQLRIARNTWDELVHQRSQTDLLENLLKNRHLGLFLATNNTSILTYFAEDEMYFLEELLKYRKQALISLQKEFEKL